MPDFRDKKSNFIDNAVKAADLLMQAYQLMREIKENNADQGFLTTSSDVNLSDSDFIGSNDHIDRALFLSTLSAGLLPVLTVIEANNNTVRKELRKILRK